MSFWYNSERETLEEFLAQCEEDRIPFAFKGYEPFQELWNKGYIEPLITLIRLMYSHGRCDECYLVVNEHELEGLDLETHSGKSGAHDPKELLSGDAPYWEISSLNHYPEPRKLSE